LATGLGIFLHAANAGSSGPIPAEKVPKGPPASSQGLAIHYPLDGTVFPPEFPPPTFQWQHLSVSNHSYRIGLDFQDSHPPLETVVHKTRWAPDVPTWETIKLHSREKPVRFTVTSIDPAAPEKIAAQSSIAISTSADEVGASIFYRDVNLPFVDAVKDPSDIRWRFGAVSTTNPPPVVLEKLPVCGNCHSFSKSGGILGMDVDYANSKGSYVITRTEQNMQLHAKDIITWDNYRREDGELTFGLLSQVSPDGQVVVSTVKDKSVFVPRPDLAFSQLFFPIKGILAIYERDTGKFASLPGADDPDYVQSNPSWSPDGRFIAFARSKAYDLKNTAGKGKVLLTPAECREFAAEGKPFRFDLYRIPFNGGKGGEAQPLAGASDDGRSNYFPKYSPDGRWIVFCKASNYMLLQPDSELYIIPANGGEARRLRCNLPRMNSWHSWSPNGKWLVFSSKGYSDYTQLFLTHMDAEGNSTPPVWLEQFTATNRAANIPEFVNLPAGGIVKIQEQFLNDYSFERAAYEFYRGGEPDRAIEKYRQTLELNPNNVTAHQRLGFLLYNVKRQHQEGLAHTAEALRLDPKNSFAHNDMGMVLMNQNQLDQAIAHLQSALESLWLTTEDNYKPQTIRYHLGKAFMQKGRFADATTQLKESIRLNPTSPDAHYLLALALICQGNIEETVLHYEKALALRPEIDSSVVLHELMAEAHAKSGRSGDAVRSAEHALKLARAAGKEEAIQRIEARLRGYQDKVAPIK
jgi:tetratricopeptide (TPR) repeat protein